MIVYDLVGGFNQPLWKMMEWVTVGMMTFPTEWKVIKHQPDISLTIINYY